MDGNDAAVQIPLTSGKAALIDAVDYPKICGYKWRFHSGYARAFKYNPSTQKNDAIHMSHLIMPCPPGMEIDHINRDRLDNRKCNLRVVTRSQNCANRGSFKNSVSQYKGVHWNKKMELWEAAIRKDGIQTAIGAFNDEVAAASAYNDYARKMWGEYAALNDIEEVDYKRMRHLKPENSRSRFRGVTMHRCGKWTARLTINGKRKTLGYFTTEEDAARAYNRAYEEYTGREGPNVI